MPDITQKAILITGGAGFIGSNFLKHLYYKYRNYKFIVLDALTYAGDVDNIPTEIKADSDRYEFWQGDVRNSELVDALVAKSNIVVHFAAETHVTRSIFDNLLFFQTDVMGTHAVASAVLKSKDKIERFIHISSSEVYGTARDEAINEDHVLMPMSPYASAKAGADRLVYSYWATYGIPAIIVRPFNNYGYNQHLEKAVARFVTSCILDEPLTVHGDGTSKRDWMFIEDHCDALDRISHVDINKIQGEVINLGTGHSLDILAIARIITQKMGKPDSLIELIGDRPGQVIRHTAGIDKARKLLGWRPQTSFESGIEKTIEWYEANRSWWEKQLWMRHIPIMTKDGQRVLH